jgi:glycosyltransferase involved in cell wall biosynthesis
MRILFLSHYFPPEVNAPASRTYEHCRRWVAAGHEVTVVTCAPNCPSGLVFDGYRNAWQSEETVDGIHVVRVWTLVAANQGFLLRIVNFLSYMLRAALYAATAPRFDLVVATSPQFFCGWAGVFASVLRRRPLVLEIRDLWPDSIVAVGAMRRSRLIRCLEWLERRLYAAAHHIITVGEDYRAGLVSKGVPAEKISVVSNGVDLEQFIAVGNSVAVRREFGLQGKFVCAYLGTVGMAHGLEVVLEAARLARERGRHDLAFWIVGDGAERARLEAAAKARKLDNVIFSGMLPKARMPEVISACDCCLVHLRAAELFSTVLPSKIFEFMALNVPIIMGVRGGARQIVLEAGAGVAMEPDQPKSLLDAIDQIQGRSKSEFAGRPFVALHFNRDRLASQMLDVLSSTSAQGRKAA